MSHLTQNPPEPTFKMLSREFTSALPLPEHPLSRPPLLQPCWLPPLTASLLPSPWKFQERFYLLHTSHSPASHQNSCQYLA